jgi:hypothetical protein
MSFQFSEKIKNERLNVVASALGPAAIMRIYTGPVPSSCEAVNPSGEIVELELPRRPFLAPNGAKLMIAEPWVGFAHADGTAKSWRVFDYLGETHMQGSVSKRGEGGDIELDTTEIHAGQKCVIGAFTLAAVDEFDASEEQRKRMREMEET